MKLVSLNLENGMHIDRHMQMLKDFDADVYCFQEMVEPHIEQYKKELNCPYHYFSTFSIKYHPDVRNVPEGEPINFGVGIVSKYPLEDCAFYRIGGLEVDIPEYIEYGVGKPEMLSQNWTLIVARVNIKKEKYQIGTFHFPRGPIGQVVTDYMRECLKRLQDALKNYGEMILTGDLNSPRGMELFDTLAKQYTDNIPSEYETSIDLAIHKNGAIDPKGLGELMIDCLFTTEQYSVNNVRLLDGMSDHMAVVADIEK